MHGTEDGEKPGQAEQGDPHVAPHLGRETEELAKALYKDGGAMLDDLREAVITLEETERIARRVFGGSHPRTVRTEFALREARAMLRARETSGRA